MADQLDLQRIGRQHQAGSDSLLTGMAFFRMKEVVQCSFWFFLQSLSISINTNHAFGGVFLFEPCEYHTSKWSVIEIVYIGIESSPLFFLPVFVLLPMLNPRSG